MICAVCGNGLQKNAIERYECTVLKETMERHGMNMEHASRELGFSLSTLKRKLLKHGIREKGKSLLVRGRKCPVVGNGGIEPS